MNPTKTHVTNERLYDEFNTVVTEAEQLLKSVAAAGNERPAPSNVAGSPPPPGGAWRASAEAFAQRTRPRDRRVRQANPGALPEWSPASPRSPGWLPASDLAPMSSGGPPAWPADALRSVGGTWARW